MEKSILQKWKLPIGANRLPNGATLFTVWAPYAHHMAVKIMGDGSEALIPMVRLDDGMFSAMSEHAPPGTDYLYVIDGEKERPDPASRWQPQGVHGPSRVVDPAAFTWSDADWKGLPLKAYVLYELHVGTFSTQGTFEGVIDKLGHLKDLGVTAIELMPIAQFPGSRNWGYDGAYLYAVQDSYGGPEGLKKLVDACHGQGLAVVLDVVYNHLGPEGNYLGDFGPYFTQKYKTPWGQAVNFDGPYSDSVRRFIIDNALYWLTEFHIDALRIDAIHGIFDFSAKHVLEELADAFHLQADSLGKQAHLIAESDLNDVRVISPKAVGGYAVDAQWNDDFHHALHVLLTGCKQGYFQDFGKMIDLAKAAADGFVYDGRWSEYRKRTHGSSSLRCRGEQLVVFLQNHDQVGNACVGKRLASIASPEQYRLAAAILFFMPSIPMLFMGQEWGEMAPFLYMTSFHDAQLAEAVREGYAKDHAPYASGEALHDPQAEEAFDRSKLDWSLLNTPQHREILDLYRKLIRLRNETTALSNYDKVKTKSIFSELDRAIVFCREGDDGSAAVLACNFSGDIVELPLNTGGRRLNVAAATFAENEGEVVAASESSVLLRPWEFRLMIGV